MATGDGGGKYERLPTDDNLSDEVADIELTDDFAEDEDEDEDEETFQASHGEVSCFKFVEAGWFQVLSGCVIIFNTVTVFLEADDATWSNTLHVPDQIVLCFYIFELFCRVSFFGKRFICGPRLLRFWNGLDVTVVSAGIWDEWVLPFMPVDKDSPLVAVVSMFRMLRLLRVMKIMRILLETDLSWTEAPPFESFIGGVIAFNGLLMGMETDIKWMGWFYIEQVLLVIYVFELVVRLKRYGLGFLSCHNPDITWNFLDFVIVVSSVGDSWMVPMVKILQKQFISDAGPQKKTGGIPISQVMMLMRLLRLMRILRLVKLVKSVQPLFVLVMGVTAAFQGVFWVLVLTVVFLYAIGILTTRLVGHGLCFPPGQPIPAGAIVFKSVPDSMFTLFRVMSGALSDFETESIDDLMIALPTIKFAFIFFMVTSSWFLLSILTAVVSDHMISNTVQQVEQIKIASDEEDRAYHKKELKDLFNSIDKGGDGSVKEEQVLEFLSDTDNSFKMAHCCNASTRNVVAVLKTLAPDGRSVKMDEFVECMLDVGKPVTEQSMMKLETLFSASQDHIDAGCRSLAEKLDKHRERAKPKRMSDERPRVDSGLLSAQLGNDSMTGAPDTADTSVIKSLNGLVGQQKKNSEGIAKLHSSVQALLRSQEALTQQYVFNNARNAKLEGDLAASEARTVSSFSILNETVEGIKSDWTDIGKLPAAPSNERPPQPLAAPRIFTFG